MDKEKISKELLEGVGSCKRQLKSIKSQLTTYLSDNEKRKEGADSKTSESPQERLRRKRTTHYMETSSNSDSDTPKKSKMSASNQSGNKSKSRGRPRKNYKDDSDSSFDEKDESYVIPSSRPSKVNVRKSRGRRRKVSSSNSQSSEEKSDDDDEAYKPNSRVPKSAKKSSNGNKKLRGRPPKKAKEDGAEKILDEVNKEHSSSKLNAPGNESEHASVDDNISKRSQDGSFEAVEGHTIESNVTDSGNKNEEMAQNQSIDSGNHLSEEEKVVKTKKRGRPSTKTKDMPSTTTEISNKNTPSTKTTEISNKDKQSTKSNEISKKGRGRPKKSVTVNGAAGDIKDNTVMMDVSSVDKTLPESTDVVIEEIPKSAEECAETAEITDTPTVETNKATAEDTVVVNDDSESA